MAVIGRAVVGWLRGTESIGDLKARLFGITFGGPAVWVHLSSVGEANAARPIISHLAKSQKVIVTTGTSTGRDTVLSWTLGNVRSGLAPLDAVWLTKRFLRKNKITTLLIVENELWPNRLLTAMKVGVPIILINARMSESTFKTWSRFSGTARRIMSGVKAVFPQDLSSSRRLETLGASSSAIREPFNLKSLYQPVSTPLVDVASSFERPKTILAAATHEGEDEVVLESFAALHQKRPDLRLIIAPRHPDRAETIEQMSQGMGFKTTLRTENPQHVGTVFIANTLGEMDQWYRAAAVAFVGGSLVPKGGHTPYEPAAYGCQIIHGPYIDNFLDAYEDLGENQVLWTASNAHELVEALEVALEAPAAALPFQAKGTDILSDLDVLCRP